MVAIAACVALVLAGAAIVLAWGGEAHAGATEPSSGASGSPRPVRYVGIALAAGLAAGLMAAGAGGRLVMRLLAVTSPEAAGSTTEAGEIVGQISLDGTLGFIVFAGVPAGLISGLLYALLRPVLPRGRPGGIALGVLLLLLAGTRVEPLRADNVDFALVGPAWLAVLAFTILGLFQGMLVVAIGERIYRDRSPARPVADRRRVLATARIAVGALLLLALPGFFGAVAEIL
jgi:hypothetical protein